MKKYLEQLKCITPNARDGREPSVRTLDFKHKAILAGYIGSDRVYSDFHLQIAHGNDKPAESTRRMLYVRLSKFYMAMNKSKPKLYKVNMHKSEEIAKLIECVIQDTFENYERKKKTVNYEDRFPIRKIARRCDCSKDTFSRNYKAIYYDMMRLIEMGLSQININAYKLR